MRMFLRRAVGVFPVLTLFLVTVQVHAAVEKQGPEFQINTYTEDDQGYPAVAATGDDGFVVVWESYEEDFSYGGIFAQRYDKEGGPVGEEFQVNTTSYENQYHASVAADSKGDFVVVWESYYQDGDELGVFGQRFSSDGTSLGTEFQVNTYTYGYQMSPSVAAAPGGSFLVVWESEEQDGDDLGIFGQRYDNEGKPVGSEFRINEQTEDCQKEPAAAAAGTGDFVVVWTSADQDEDGYGVFGRKLPALIESSPGPEFQVNTHMDDDQYAPSVAADARGDFVVVWTSEFQDESDSSVFGRLFDAGAVPRGDEFRLHENADPAQTDPSVTSDRNGNFVVAWTRTKAAQGEDSRKEIDVMGRAFDHDGNPLSPEFQVNTYTTGNQSYQRLAIDDEGRFLVVWTSGKQDGDGDGVFGQRFSVELPPPPCTGDCNENRTVTVDELVRGVNIALGTLPVERCPAFDRNEDGTVTVDELVRAVNAALEGCSA